MCKRLTCLTFVLVLLACAGNAGAAKIDPATVTDGHVYLFDNVGTNVPDDSANSNTGTFVGNPQVVNGLNGKALQFDGIDDGVLLPDSTPLNLSTCQDRTVVALFKCADVNKTEKQCVYATCEDCIAAFPCSGGACANTECTLNQYGCPVCTTSG